MALVVSDGVDGLTIGRLAAEIDYTKGALYRYFPSKDAIVSAMVLRVIRDLARDVDEERERFGTPLSRLVASAWTYRDFARTRPRRFALLGTLLAASERVLPQPADVNPVVHEMIETLRPLDADLRGAIAAGELTAGDTIERTLTLFATLHGVLSLHKQAALVPEWIDLDHLTLGAVRTLLLGWGASSPAVEEAIELVVEPAARPGDTTCFFHT